MHIHLFNNTQLDNLKIQPNLNIQLIFNFLPIKIMHIHRIH